MYNKFRVTTEVKIQNTYQMVNVIDFVYLFNCIFDTLLYTLWFKEARFEILKIFSKLCVRLQPSVEKMRLEVYSIITFKPVEADNTTTNYI